MSTSGEATRLAWRVGFCAGLAVGLVAAVLAVLWVAWPFLAG